MNKQYLFISLILTIILVACQTKSDLNCGYNGKTIRIINDQNASIKDVEDQFILHFEEGIKIDSPNLLDTIYFLLPCNLPDQFKVDNQEVKISGEIKENPAYSSHNDYTDFYINKITKY